MNKEEEREITEFAEHLYNLGEFMDIESIKGSIESFLLANHYVQLPKDKPELREKIADIIYEILGGDSEFDKEGGYCPCAELAEEKADQILALIKG